MKKYDCPSCGAGVLFVSNLSVYAVCAYCNTTVVRNDVNLQAIGNMAELPDDMSPFQIGTELNYRGNHFTIIGRLKIGWHAGTWNEWFMITANGNKAWLAEAQGFYAVCHEVENALDTQSLERVLRQASTLDNVLNNKPASNNAKIKTALRPGSYLTVNNKRLKLVDFKIADCIGSEGELPFQAAAGRRSISIDLVGPDGEFGCIEILNQSMRVFTGYYADWNELNCSRTRELENW